MNMRDNYEKYEGPMELAPHCAKVPAQALPHFREGLEQLNVGEPAAAVLALNAALEHAPNHPDVHVALGVAYAMTSQIYPAIDHLTRASDLEPGSFHAQFKLAQLYFTLRVPAKGYELARRALSCAETLEERRLIAQLLRHERQREHHGIARPWFNKAFSRSALWIAGSGTAALIAALVLHLH